MIKYEKYDINELDKNRIMCQIQKTGNTIFTIKNVNIMVENLKLPISQLNYLRREAIEKFEIALENSIKREYPKPINLFFQPLDKTVYAKPKINVFVQKFDENVDYAKLDYYEIYVPIKDLAKAAKLRDCIAVLPNVVDESYETWIAQNKALFDSVKAVQIGHISQIELLKKLNIAKKVVADYTLNITNYASENVIKNLGIERFTISPELGQKAINQFTTNIEKELVVYGRTCLMTSKYCPIGKNENCKMACKQGNYVLRDRKNFEFPVVCDWINCHSRIYNSKILSIEKQGFEVDFVRMDVLDETEEQIINIFNQIKNGKRMEGQNYTNGYQ